MHSIAGPGRAVHATSASGCADGDIVRESGRIVDAIRAHAHPAPASRHGSRRARQRPGHVRPAGCQPAGLGTGLAAGLAAGAAASWRKNAWNSMVTSLARETTLIDEGWVMPKSPQVKVTDP